MDTLKIAGQARSEIIATHMLENLILHIRGKRVLLDADLANLYQVSTKRLNEQIKRNINRFPEDFLFQLTQEESSLRSQFATSRERHGGRLIGFTANHED